MQVFNVNIEFDPQIVRTIIEQHIQQREKAYVCVIDSSVIANAYEKMDYRKIVNEATVNICDGSSISMMVNKLYGTNYQAYSGPDIFEYYIERPYKHLLLGNTVEKANQIQSIVTSKGYNVDIQHLDIPFASIDMFDFQKIAIQINNIKPDIIWVSLGNPKQEIFMNRIMPFITQGVMFGIGAAFNYYTGEFHNNKKEFFGLRLHWLERMLKEPKKNWIRNKHDFPLLIKMYREERRKVKSKDININ